jgi:hypothetical protein
MIGMKRLGIRARREVRLNAAGWKRLAASGLNRRHRRFRGSGGGAWLARRSGRCQPLQKQPEPRRCPAVTASKEGDPRKFRVDPTRRVCCVTELLAWDNGGIAAPDRHVVPEQFTALQVRLVMRTLHGLGRGRSVNHDSRPQDFFSARPPHGSGRHQIRQRMPVTDWFEALTGGMSPPHFGVRRHPR